MRPFWIRTRLVLLFRKRKKKKKDIKYSETPPPGRLNYSNVQEVKPTPALAGCKGQKLLHHAQVKVCIHYSVKPEKNPTSPLVFVQGERKTPALEFLVFVHSPPLRLSSSSSSSSLLHPFIDGAFSKYYHKIQKFAGVKRSISRAFKADARAIIRASSLWYNLW